MRFGTTTSSDLGTTVTADNGTGGSRDAALLSRCKAAITGQPKAYLEQGKVATSCCSRQDQERLSKEHKEDVRVLLLNHGVQDGYA